MHIWMTSSGPGRQRQEPFFDQSFIGNWAIISVFRGLDGLPRFLIPKL